MQLYITYVAYFVGFTLQTARECAEIAEPYGICRLVMVITQNYHDAVCKLPLSPLPPPNFAVC